MKRRTRKRENAQEYDIQTNYFPYKDVRTRHKRCNYFYTKPIDLISSRVYTIVSMTASFAKTPLVFNLEQHGWQSIIVWF
mmetsp:Transcript_39180/g.58869  ORF Transcript_39180/g.58869 Transcript_39180/m.58869 type:complete len:80 (+) Transcript_39180:101-340(+)